jgi:uncharacterized protein with GYD domain
MPLGPDAFRNWTFVRSERHLAPLDRASIVCHDALHIYKRSICMPHYLHQIAYSREGWDAIVNSPEDRIEAVRPAIEKLNGKIDSAWFAFGDYDLVVVTEMPNNVNAAAIAIAFAAGGACRAVQTTPLLSVAEGVEAMKKAKESGYRPATAKGRAA